MSYINISPNKDDYFFNKIHYVSYAKFENDWQSLPHLHRFTEFILVTGGEGNFVVAEKFYKIKKGDFIIVPTNVMHTEVSGNSALSYYAVGFLEQHFTYHIKDKFIFNAPEQIFNQLFNCFEHIFYELRKKRQNYEQIAQNYLDNIILLSSRITKNISAVSGIVNAPKIQTAIDYIDSNYSLDITLEKLCDITFLSKTHLIRLFKEHTNQTPVIYIMLRKIQAAKTLLLTTDLSIMEIAMTLNFATSSYFILQFKKYEKMTPNKYRNLMLG